MPITISLPEAKVMSVLLSCLRCVMTVLYCISGVKMGEIGGVAECIFECECECVAVFMDVQISWLG